MSKKSVCNLWKCVKTQKLTMDSALYGRDYGRYVDSTDG